MTVERCTICRLPNDKRAEVEAAYKTASGASDIDAAVLDVSSRYRITRLALRRHQAHTGPIGVALCKAPDVPSRSKNACTRRDTKGTSLPAREQIQQHRRCG